MMGHWGGAIKIPIDRAAFRLYIQAFGINFQLQRHAPTVFEVDNWAQDISKR